jgi:hypothetical protein
MPVFDNLRNQLHAAVDGMFAETVQLVSFENGRQVGDGISIKGLLKDNDRQDTPISGYRSENFQTEARFGGATLCIDRFKYPEIKLKKGDRVRAIEREGEPGFSVVSVDDRQKGRLIVNLGNAG